MWNLPETEAVIQDYHCGVWRTAWWWQGVCLAPASPAGKIENGGEFSCLFFCHLLFSLLSFGSQKRRNV